MQTNPAQLNTNTEALIRIALLVEYCGSAFNGSQFQPNQPTVQAALQDALIALNLQTSAVSFAGRTDAGVHAKGQVAHFDVDPESLSNIPNLLTALNAVLPATVAVRDLQFDAGTTFNSRKLARAKWYRYVVYSAPERSVWAGADAAYVRKSVDDVRMNQAAQLLIGTHNFESFKCPDTPILDSVCTVHDARVTRENNRVIFDIVADRFVYKMVRNITGQLLDISKQGAKPESILEVMAQQDRTRAAAIAPPEGLSLMAVSYDAPHNFFHTDLYVQQLNQTLINRMESNDENLFRKAS